MLGANLAKWLAQHEEDAIDPERPIVDCHHHLFNAGTQNRGWPLPNWKIKLLFALPKQIRLGLAVRHAKAKEVDAFHTFSHFMPLAHVYMPFQFRRDRENGNRPNHNVVKSVYIECGWRDPIPDVAMQPCGESVAVQNQSDAHGFPHAIVGHVDLTLGLRVEPALAAHCEVARVRGIRFSLAWSADTHLMNGTPKTTENLQADPEFRVGFGLLRKYNLLFETWIYHEQLPGICELAAAFPQQTIIVNHVGMPIRISSYSERREEIFEEWKVSLRNLSENPNVLVKLSGLTMPPTGFGFHERQVPPSSDEVAEALRPYILHAIECFGPERCMFASNFPMDKVSCSYTVLFNAFKKIVAHFSETHKSLMFHDNAMHVYGLDVGSAEAIFSQESYCPQEEGADTDHDEIEIPETEKWDAGLCGPVNLDG